MDAPTTEELTPERVGEWMRNESSRKQSELRQSILTAADTNPDQYAEATKLGRTANVPPEFVAVDMDTYRNDMKLDSQTAEKIVSLYPKYEAWLSEPDNAKLAHDDVHAMTHVLDTIRAFPAGGVQMVGQGVQGLGSLSTSASQVLGEQIKKSPIMQMDSNMQMARIFTGLFGYTAQPAGEFVRDVGEVIAPPEERQNTATNISSGLGQVAGQILMFYATGGTATTAMMVGQGSQQQTDRLDAAGVTDPTQRLIAQGLGGAATALTERIELGVLLKGVPGLDKVMGQLPKALQSKWSKRIIDVGAAGGAEAAQETIEGFLQDTIEYATYNQDVEFLKGMKQQAGEAGAVGVISRALILGITSGKSGAGAIKEGADREAVKKGTEQSAEAVKSTKLQSRDPEKMREVLKDGNDEGKSITLDGTVVQQFYQSGIDPEEFFNLAPSAREQFDQADAAGTDVSIPLDEFLHAIASAPDNSYDFMTDFMKVDPDVDPALQGWDLQDPEELQAFIQQTVRQAQEEHGARFEREQELSLQDTIERQIRDNLMNKNLMGEKVRSAEAAATEAQLYGSFAKALLQRGDTAAARVFERRFGTNFQVEGYKPPVKRVGTGSAYYDKLAKKVKAKARAQSKPPKKDLFGKIKPKKAKATPTPLINALVSRGGIQRGSKIAAELDHIGITPKTHPRLFSKNGMGDIDNIPLEELEGDLGTTGVFSRDEDLNGYVDRQELIDKLRDETFGDYIRTDEQLEQEQIDEQEQQILDLLSEEGVDITTASKEEIEAAIDNATTRLRLEYETAQPGSFYQSPTIEQDVEDLKQKIIDEVGLKTLSIYPSKGDLTINVIIVDKDQRGQGKGTQAMNMITDFADKNGLRVKLSPAQPDDFQGTTSRSRLVSFYKRFGFVENKGKNKDFSISEGMYRDPQGKQFFQSAKPTDTPAFKEWFGDSKVVDEDGKPLVVYHGTTHDIESFNTERGNIENDLGLGFYFTNNQDEVSENYAGEGPDLTGRIERLAEQIDSNEEIGIESAREQARKQLSGGSPNVVPAYISMQKPLEIGGDNETFLDMEESFDEETEEYGEPQGAIIDFIEALRESAGNYDDADVDSAVDLIFEHARDEGGISASELIDLLKSEPAGLLYAMNENGDLAGNEIIRNAFEIAGYDGIIDRTVNDKFGSGRTRGKSMSGMDENTVHYIAFKPEQVKSIFNQGTFDPNDARIYRQGERGVTQFDGRGQTIVKLFEGADESTMLHETGHVFLDIFQEIALEPDAPQDIKDQWAATLEWLGVESHADIKTDQHEKFARGFEAYLYKGEAPSASLQGIFASFKLWLSNLYRSIKLLNVNVSPQMKEVFDRLLATEQEIEALRSNPVFSVDESTLEMLNAQQKETYLKRKAKAIQEAKDKLFRKAIRQARRQKKDWWKEEASGVQAEVEKELQSQNIYRAIQFLQTGENFDGEKLVEDSATFKLDESLVIKAFDDAQPSNPLGKEELKYLPRGVRAKEGGLDPRIVADMFGFRSAHQMLTAMQNVTPYKQAVQKQTEDRMIERHGDMLNDGTIEQEALAMVMAEDTAAAQVELEALSERTGVLYPSDGDFGRAAEIALGKLSVDHAVKPEKYYRAALKAAREYGKALGKQDYEAAAEAKRREILNKHLHKLSRKAREETDRALKHFKKLEKQPAKGNARAVKIDPDYHQKIWDLMDKYNLDPRLSDAKRLRLELKAMNDWIKAKETDEDASIIMPPELLAADEKQHYRDLTMNEFKALRDLIVNLETQGRNKRKYQLDGQQRDLEELKSELIDTADQFNEPLAVGLSERRKKGLFKGIGKIINGIDAVNTKISQVMAKLDGGQSLGIWTRTVYEPMQRAEIERNIRQRKEFDAFNALIKQHYADEKGGFLDNEVVGGIEPVRHEEMLMIALHQGTEDNRTKLLDGYKEARGWSQDYIDQILENMREKDWNFVMDTWKYLDSFWAETSAVEKRRFGYAPEKIEALPFEVTTAEGKVMQIPGGYMRIMYDSDQDVMAGNDELAQTFKDLQIGKNARAATKRGSQIERQSGVRRPMRLDLDVITEHVSEQVGIITMAETVENINKVLRAKDIQEKLQEVLGRDGKQMIDLWLKDVAVGGQLSGGVVNRSLRTIRANYTVGRLGLRPITALLQFSGLTHTIADIGGKQTMIGLSKMFSRGNPYTMAHEVAQKSVFMQERRFTLNRDIADALGAYTRGADNVKQKVSAMMLYPMQKTQELVDTATWLGVYDKSIKEGMDDADAIRTADIAVARLQASGLTSDLAAIERGTLSVDTQRQEAVKAMTMFFSYFNAKYNLLKNKNIQFKNKQISGVDLAMSYFLALLVEGAISSAIMGQIDWDSDDDEELSAKEIAFGITGMTINNAASTIPFVRTISGGAQGFSGETAAGGQLAGLGEFAGRLIGTGEKLIEGDAEKINYYSLTRNAVDALNIFAPLPASTVNQFIRGMERQDKTGEASAMDYLVYREDRF